MKFLKLRKVSVKKGSFSSFKGHVLVNLASVKTITKYRDDAGANVTRISFIGEDKLSDVWVEESPQQMADLYLKDEKKQLEGEFKPTAVRLRPMEQSKIGTPPIPEVNEQQPKAEFQEHMFDTMYEEIEA